MTASSTNADVIRRGDDDGSERPVRAVRGHLRQAAIDVVTAGILERRADGAVSPALAVLLRERAHARRGRAERLLSGVDTPRSAT
jgi:hypothetical protein